MPLCSPEDTIIIGTLEALAGCTGILDESITPKPDGGFDFDYSGDTRVYWDGQVTVERADAHGNPQRVFLDQHGDEFLESELRLVTPADALTFEI